MRVVTRVVVTSCRLTLETISIDIDKQIVGSSTASVSDLYSYSASVFRGKSRLLNYIYPKTTDPHTRRASLPASQQVSQHQILPHQSCLLFLLFTSLNSFVFTYICFLRLGFSVKSDCYFFLAETPTKPTNVNKHKQTPQTNTFTTN